MREYIAIESIPLVNSLKYEKGVRMEIQPENQVLQSRDETIKAFVRELNIAVEQKDMLHMAELVHADVFVLGAAAEAISIGRNQFMTDLRSQIERINQAQLYLQPPEIQVGLSDSGRSAWFLDRFVVNIVEHQKVPRQIPIRLTGLLTREQEWRLSAAFWSIPLRDNDYQHKSLQNGMITAGVALVEKVAPEAQVLAESIRKVTTESQSMPGMYSTCEDSFTIGSTVDEVFRADEGKNWVQEIVNLPVTFAVRGGIRSAVAPDGQTAWLAAHIDLNAGLTVPYRFFYIWLREHDGWKIVLSHDAVSVDPFNPSIEVS
jgi:ketosteroid isomerase-like protein